jgi:hypothetical protein
LDDASDTTVTDESTAAQPPIIAPPRIGNGALSILAGLGAFALAVFAGLAAAGGAEGAGLAAAALTPIGSLLLAVGVLKWLFHMIERRLVDIETTLRR